MMGLARIMIEQNEPERWYAEVEIGGLIARREEARGATFDELMENVCAAYRKIVPQPEPELAPAPRRGHPPKSAVE